MSLLVVTEAFPNRFQGYVLNAIEQAAKRGASVTIAAGGQLGEVRDKRIADLGLLDRTEYFRLESAADVAHGLTRYLTSPFSKQFRRTYGGLWRLITNHAWQPLSSKDWIKASLKASLLGQGHFDLMHAHYLSGAYDYLFVSQILGIPLITTFHGLPTRGGTSPLSSAKAQRLFQGGDLFLSNSRFAQDQIEAAGCPREKLRTLPQGVRLADFPYRPKPYPQEGFVVLLTVARLSIEKGHRFALEAVSKLRRDGRRVQYRIVGSGFERTDLENLARELGISDLVHFTGSLDETDLRRQYQEAHIFILPSVADRDGYHTETQGVVIQEAQASGLIAVASRTGGIPEFVDDGRSAFLVPERDSEALAQAVAHIMDHPERWQEWQQKGRLWVEAHFDIAAIGERLWEIYAERLEAFRPGPNRE